MKNKIIDSIGKIDNDLVESVDELRQNQRKQSKPIWIRWGAIAACIVILAGAVVGVFVPQKGNQTQGGSTYPMEIKTVSASYPAPVAEDLSAQSFMEGDAHWEWWDGYRTEKAESQELQKGITDYYTAIMQELLAAGDENTVCSPLNTYFAFAMMAEISGGNTRQQILEMLGTSDIETLRKNVSVLWQSNYINTPVLKSVLANSLWLNNRMNYTEDTLNILAEQYYASSFSGVPGSTKLDNALRNWTDENTKGLLSEYTKDMSTNPEMVIELLSTIYFQAMWMEEFQENRNTQEIFHGTAGDTTVDMMHKDSSLNVYQTDQFTAVGLPLTDSGSMYFLLPNENVDVNSLASNPDIMNIVQYDLDDENWAYPLVHLSLPKFKVSGKIDLLEAAQALGVIDVLDYTVADFTPLTTDRDDIYLNKAEHAAMVEIDEHGVTGAAYTELGFAGAGMIPEEIEVVLDRPFMFMITAGDGSILFAGIVRNID